MARTTADICLTLRPSTVRAVDAAREGTRRSRSHVIDLMLSQALTGKDRLAALQAIADAELADIHASATRDSAPNATAVIAESCIEGRARLDALQKIAAGGKR